MAEAPLTPIPRLTITDQIVERITAFILDERLRPGDKLPSERELMVRLGVGRSSLREAIKTLSALGIVVVQIGDGMYVGRGQVAALSRPLSWGLLIGEHTVREVVEARFAVETALAKMAANNATDEELATIKTKLEAMRAGADRAETYTEADQDFHMAVAAAAHNGVLYHMLETLQHVIRVWIFKSYISHTIRYDAVPEHERIYQALVNHNSEEAEQAMVDHLTLAGNRLLTILAQSATDDTQLEVNGEDAVKH